MGKLKKIMYYIITPLMGIGLIALVVLLFIALVGDKSSSWPGWLIFGIIIGAAFILSLLIYLFMNPFVKKEERKVYEDSVSQDFSNISDNGQIKIVPVLGYDEIIKIQKDGFYFGKLHKLIKYQDMTLSIHHKEFYGRIDNYIKIKVDHKKYKDFPNACFIDYSKVIMYQLLKYQVEVNNLENLQINKKTKDKKKILEKYHYSYKGLIIKILLSIILITVGTCLLFFIENKVFGYLALMPAVLIWINNNKSGTLMLTDDSVILKRNFVTVEILYEEIININLNDKHMVISSPFNFIEFENNEELANKIVTMANQKSSR